MFSEMSFMRIDAAVILILRFPIISTHWHILLKTYCSGSGDGGGFGDGGGGGCSGHQGAGLTRLRGFRRLGLGLSLSQSQAAWCGNGALHLHWRVTGLLSILDILYTQHAQRRINKYIYVASKWWNSNV